MHDSLFDSHHDMQNNFDDPFHHQDNFSDLHHNNDHSVGVSGNEGTKAAEQHASSFDISQFLDLGPVGHLIEMLQSGHLEDLGHLGHPLDLGPISHLIEMFQPQHMLDPVSNLVSQVTGPHYDHFQLGQDMHSIIGHPLEDISFWHQQQHADTCAVVSQEFIIESLTGQHTSEDTLMYEAMNHGWYIPGGGTPMDHVGDLLTLHGIPVEKKYGASLEEMVDKLDHHQKVIAGLNAEDIWYHGGPNDPLTAYPGIPGQQADHAVEVIGMNNSDPTHPLVIINDPGAPDGRGIEIPLEVFQQAWIASDCYMVTATNVSQFSTDGLGDAAPLLGGYYNADGTYHYTSDNTDRDPQTGAIVRRW